MSSMYVTVEGELWRVAFGDPADNSQIVRDAESRLQQLEQEGLNGSLVLINGPASLAVAVVLAHHLVHRFAAVGVFDPKLGSYVISAAHGAAYNLGDLIPQETVQPA